MDHNFAALMFAKHMNEHNLVSENESQTYAVVEASWVSTYRPGLWSFPSGHIEVGGSGSVRQATGVR